MSKDPHSHTVLVIVPRAGRLCKREETPNRADMAKCAHQICRCGDFGGARMHACMQGETDREREGRVHVL